jgi:hypothetical protein
MGMETIQRPLEFFGVTNYQRGTFYADQDSKPELVKTPVGHPLTAFRWRVDPKSP